jgi:hypothetical protein
VSVVEPHPDPETVATLLDTAWRTAAAESQRTDSLDRKMATLATFSSILASIAAVGAATLSQTSLPRWLEVAISLISIGAISALTASVIVAVVALLPKELVTHGTEYLRRFPTWSEILKPPARVRGETLRTVIENVVAERSFNEIKLRRVRVAFLLLAVGVALVALGGVTLLAWTAIA